MTLGFFGHLAALLAYLLLTILLVASWRGRLVGLLAVLAAVATILWAAMGIALSNNIHVPMLLAKLIELLRTGTWLLFLATILVTDHNSTIGRPWKRGVWWMIAAGVGTTLALPIMAAKLGLSEVLIVQVPLMGWSLLAVFGLLLVEQVFRNRPPERRSEINHLCLGLGSIFVYDLYFYSDALLLQRIDPHLWEARGIVNALIVPLVAVSAARNPSWSLGVHVSRSVVFYSATLFGSSLYLIAMSVTGYYLRYLDRTWGAPLQITFLFVASMLLVLLLFSTQLRARLRVLLSKHFFSFKYDYRKEWLRFTNALSRSSTNLPEAVVTAVAEIVDSPGGMLWVKNENGSFELAERIDMPEPETLIQSAEHPMVHFLIRLGWVIDLDEYALHPQLYQDFECPGWLAKLPTAWLIIPLLFCDQMCGFLVLTRSRFGHPLNWEDRSLLKTAGHQAAGHVAQYLTDQALMRVRQFEAFNQLSAYVAHDLKNLLAQQSLIISNAERHKDNPEFLDDVIRTIKSSVERMNRLMNQLRNGVRGEQQARLLLDREIRETIAAHMNREPRPQVKMLCEGLWIVANQERLRTVFGHIIQNAQDATPADGTVIICLIREGCYAVVEITDNGAGMSPEFIRDRLFRPFDSTKGLTGMGIGAFESREFVRLLGGDLMVRSTPGKGTVFRILLPYNKNSENSHASGNCG